ncbi:MAG: RDD family protein [bacterium]|nr:RDD family protein [bacterium]MDI1337361.1 RDD family protein [Lacunisphaera sp.]
MKFKLTPILSVLWLALALASLPALRAQQVTPPATPAPATTEQAATAAKTSEADKPAPATEAPAAAATPAAEETKPPVAAADDAKKVEEKSAEPEKPATEVKTSRKIRSIGASSSRRSNNERVSFGHGSTLAAGESADTVVSILGSSTSAGDVSDVVVSVIGNTSITGGTVGDAAVAVLGNVYVNGHVKGEIVAVLGNIELGPDAIVDGEIVCIGGEMKRDTKAVAHGNVQNIAIGGRHFNFDKLQAWFTECALYGRLLAFGPNLHWAWVIAVSFLVFYLLLALMAPTGVTKCVETLEDRPGYSLLSAVLTLLLTPVAFILLALTLAIGIGFALIPLFSLGLFFAGLFGKTVMLAWLGRRLTKLFGDGPLAHPAVAVLIGGIIVLLLYTVPVVGFVVYKLLGILGLGVVLYTLLLQYKASRPVPLPRLAPVAAGAGMAVSGMTAGEMAAPPVLLPPVISAATLPRAGFWIRIAASFLDMAMVGIAYGMLNGIIWHGLPGIPPFWYAVYCVIMWATKGTTIGGIVCGLKVVRLDDRPIDWSIAIVRGLSAFLSAAVAGLGFIWVAFDDEKQSWHDKIAGTTIVRVPKGTALL